MADESPWSLDRNLPDAPKAAVPSKKKKVLRLKRIGEAPGNQEKPILPQNQRESRINEIIIDYLCYNKKGAFEEAIRGHVLQRLRNLGEAGVMMDEDVWDFVDKQLLALKKIGLLREYKVTLPPPPTATGPDGEVYSMELCQPYGWHLKKKHQQGIRMYLELTKNV